MSPLLDVLDELAEKDDCATSDKEDAALPEGIFEISEGEAASLMEEFLNASAEGDEDEEEAET